MKGLLFSLVFILLLNCTDSDIDDDRQANCNNIACTEIFVSIIVTIKDTSGAFVSLDRFKVTDLKTGQDLTKKITEGEMETFRQNGMYPLYDDLFVEGNLNTSRNIIFKGFLNDIEVVNAEYVVGTDCCHISLVSGNPDIIIN